MATKVDLEDLHLATGKSNMAFLLDVRKEISNDTESHLGNTNEKDCPRVNIS